jgi:hypothetical protein
MMPTAKNAPKELNDLLEKVYSNCLSNKANTKAYCSKVSWDAAKKQGWFKDVDGKWTKKRK